MTTLLPKPRRVVDKKFTAFIVSLPCCITGAPGPSDPHHSDMGHGTMGGKASDYRQEEVCCDVVA